MQELEIEVNFNDKESLKASLKTLNKKMLKIFNYTENNSYFMCENYLPIITNEGKSITKEEMFDNEILDKVIGLAADLSKNNLFKIDETYVDNSLNVFTQCYLVHKALENGLENEVLDFVENIVAFSIKINDSSYFWYDECNVYGIDIITTLALHNPKYIHLISEYIIPYWDDEHAPYIFEYLPYFMKKHGFSKDILKALAYTHSIQSFFACFMQYDEQYGEVSNGKLFEHFKDNYDDYIYFKEEFFNYLRKYPRSNEDEDFVHLSTKIFKVIIGENLEERFEEEFTSNTIEEELVIFSDEIDEVLEDFSLDEYPFIRDEDGETEELEDYEEDILDTIRINEEFFMKGFDNGEKIYDYVLYGKNKELLKDIKKVKDFKYFAAKKELKILKRFNYYGVDFLSDIAEPFITQQLECEVRQSFIGKFLNKQRDISPKQRALRAFDVLFRAYGQDLDEFSIRQLTQEYELCSLDEVFKRYSLYTSKEDLIKQIQGLMNKFYGNETSREDLEQLNALFLKDKTLWDDILSSVMHNKTVGVDEDIIQIMPKLSRSDIKGSYLVSVAFIIHKNFNENDENIQKLINFFKNNVFIVFATILKEYGKTSYYVENDTVDQSYLVDEVLKYCIDSSYDYEKIKENMRELSYINEAENDTKYVGHEMGIPMLGLFSSDEMQGLLASIVYIYKYVSKDMQEQILRIYTLILDLAPVKTINGTSKSFFNQYSKEELEKNPLVYYDFIELLENMGLKSEYILAWEINRANRNKYRDFFANRLESLSEDYISDSQQSGSMIDAYRNKNVVAIKDSIQYLDFITKREFLKLINDIEPSDEYFICCKKQFDKMNFDFARRLTPWDNPEWNMDEDEKLKYKETIEANAKLIEDFLFNNSSFDEIQEKIVNQKDHYTPDDLSEIIPHFDTKIQDKYFYLICKIGYINRVYDHVRVAYEDEFETYGLTHKLFYKITSLGIDESFALMFILSQATREAQYAEDDEDKNFLKALMDIYPQIDLYEISKDYKENKIIFILREVANDEREQTQEIKKQILEKFTNHNKLKVQKVAKSFLEGMK
ncbi:hypothetical protein [Arcobacter sp. YIC-310]|uniref:hypothetical protein n=1 Tax=Arcobacter sp. YIC-310 TaxID=3376632 RepID=UPI003C1B5F41